jgi:hypothetical protein
MDGPCRHQTYGTWSRIAPKARYLAPRRGCQAPGAARLGGIEGGLGAAKVPVCATFPSSVPLLVTENSWPAHECGTLLDRVGRVSHS